MSKEAYNHKDKLHILSLWQTRFPTEAYKQKTRAVVMNDVERTHSYPPHLGRPWKQLQELLCVFEGSEVPKPLVFSS